MKGINSNISTLFESLGKGNNNTFDYSNYASIKNGSYGKMLKSYYSEQKKYAAEIADIKSQLDSEKKKAGYDKNDGVVDKNLSTMKKEADGLKSAAETFAKDDLWKQTNGKYDMDKIADAVKSFANEYNDVVSSASKVSSKEVSQSAKYMTDLTNAMSKSLSKVGVTVSATGKMSVNEDTLKNADVKDVKALFSGNSSYGNQMAEKAGEIARATVMSAGLYSDGGTVSNSFSSMFSKMI